MNRRLLLLLLGAVPLSHRPLLPALLPLDTITRTSYSTSSTYTSSSQPITRPQLHTINTRQLLPLLLPPPPLLLLLPPTIISSNSILIITHTITIHKQQPLQPLPQQPPA